MKIINFVPQQKVDISPLIKINYIIPKNSNKNLIIKINEKDKGKENLRENKINKIRSEKKLKIIKLNLNQSQNKSQGNKFMTIGRRTVKNESTQYDRTYHRSTPIEQNI